MSELREPPPDQTYGFEEAAALVAAGTPMQRQGWQNTSWGPGHPGSIWVENRDGVAVLVLRTAAGDRPAPRYAATLTDKTATDWVVAQP